MQGWWYENQETLAIVGLAAIVGSIIGCQRVYLSLGASLRVHSAVAMGAALFVHIPVRFFPDINVAAVVQGVATGIGFIGAGAILQRPSQQEIQGITVAGTIWLAAALGMVTGVGAGALAVVIAAVALLFIILSAYAFREG